MSIFRTPETELFCLKVFRLRSLILLINYYYDEDGYGTLVWQYWQRKTEAQLHHCTTTLQMCHFQITVLKSGRIKCLSLAWMLVGAIFIRNINHHYCNILTSGDILTIDIDVRSIPGCSRLHHQGHWGTILISNKCIWCLISWESETDFKHKIPKFTNL